MKQLLVFVAVVVLADQAQARDYVDMVGSSTVYPFATVVAERFGKTTFFRTPKVESTGSGGGVKLFCAGIGVEYPDIVNTSRRIKQSELERCRGNRVHEIIEVKIGYDGIVLAHSGQVASTEISRRQLFLALAAEVPDLRGGARLIPNPYQQWKDLDPSLPDTRIKVLGPPPTSGTRDSFAELGLESGCQEFAWIAAMKQHNKLRYQAVCHTLREDGGYVEVGENDNLIVQKLLANPTAFGVLGYGFLDQNTDRIQGAVIDGVAPTFEHIADRSYPISRPLYVYVKKRHIDTIPGLRAYLEELTSEKAWGPDGYLSYKGMISMSDTERTKYRAAVEQLMVLDLAAP